MHTLRHTGIVLAIVPYPLATSHKSKQIDLFLSPNIIRSCSSTTFSDSTEIIIFYEQPQHRASARTIFPSVYSITNIKQISTRQQYQTTYSHSKTVLRASASKHPAPPFTPEAKPRSKQQYLIKKPSIPTDSTKRENNRYTPIVDLGNQEDR